MEVLGPACLVYQPQTWNQEIPFKQDGRLGLQPKFHVDPFFLPSLLNSFLPPFFHLKTSYTYQNKVLHFDIKYLFIFVFWHHKSWKNCSYFPLCKCVSLEYSFLFRDGNPFLNIPLRAGTVYGLSLSRPCALCYSLWEFICASFLFYMEDTVSFLFGLL